jgi:hypothetical protein
VGTNFYLMASGTHVGKRSAAGLYCFDCDVTLCKGGEEHVYAIGNSWYEVCPECFQEPTAQRYNAAHMELGLILPLTERPRGVASCCSFSWAVSPEAIGAMCRLHPNDPIIEDEYHRSYTGEQFRTMLEVNCPIRHTRSMGTVFC